MFSIWGHAPYRYCMFTDEETETRVHTFQMIIMTSRSSASTYLTCSFVKAALCWGAGTRLACAGRGRWEALCDGYPIGERSLLSVLPSLPSLSIILFPANISDPWWPFLLNILCVGSLTATVAMGAALGNSVLSRRGKGNTYPQVLWRFNCHMTLREFKVYNIMIWHMYMLQNDHHSKNS